MADWSPSARQVERDAVRRRLRRRSATVATVATVVLLGLLAIAVTTSPGWTRVQDDFLLGDAKASFPEVQGLRQERDVVPDWSPSARQVERDAVRRRLRLTLGDGRDGGHGRGARPAGLRRHHLARVAARAGDLLLLGGREGVVPRGLQGLRQERPAVPHRRATDPGARRAGRRRALDDVGGPVPAPAAGGVLHRPPPRRPDAAGGHPGRLRHPGAAAPGHHQRHVLARAGGAGAVVRRLRRRGLPGRHRLDPPLADGQRRRARPLARAGDALRRPPAGHPSRGAAAAQRLHLAPEGHRAAVVDLRLRGAVRGEGLRRPTTSTTRRSWSSPCSSWR